MYANLPVFDLDDMQNARINVEIELQEDLLGSYTSLYRNNTKNKQKNRNAASCGSEFENTYKISFPTVPSSLCVGIPTMHFAS